MARAIRFHDVVALAGTFPLLAGIDLDVVEGEVVHLRGANGAGKTSLLRAVAGLVAITSGEAEVLGHDLRVDRRSVRREIGLLGHSSFLYEELNARDNLRFAAKAARVEPRAVAPALERVGIVGRLATVPVARLSSGQRRRTAIAVLLARWPRLWLLDEPHAGLDEGARQLVDDVISEVRAAGRTVLVASHELGRAGQLADRTVTIAGGQALPFAAPAPAAADQAGEQPKVVVRAV